MSFCVHASFYGNTNSWENFTKNLYTLIKIFSWYFSETNMFGWFVLNLEEQFMYLIRDIVYNKIYTIGFSVLIFKSWYYWKDWVRLHEDLYYAGIGDDWWLWTLFSTLHLAIFRLKRGGGGFECNTFVNSARMALTIRISVWKLVLILLGRSILQKLFFFWKSSGWWLPAQPLAVFWAVFRVKP